MRKLDRRVSMDMKLESSLGFVSVGGSSSFLGRPSAGALCRGCPGSPSQFPRRRARPTMEVKPLDPGFISTLPKQQQAAITFGISAGIALGTVFLVDKVVPVLRLAPYAKPVSRLVGVPFILAGIAHFTDKEGFREIYPDRGEWGWWYLPGSAEFHVGWTGVAEIIGGLGVLLGDLPMLPGWVGPYASAGLFLLTIAVTPANLKSISHGLSGPAKGVAIPAGGHVFRALLQCGLLSIFWSLATGYRL